MDKTIMVDNKKENGVDGNIIGKLSLTKKRKKTINKCKKPKIILKNAKKCVYKQVSPAFEDSDKKFILDEIERMKIWVKTLLSIYGTIPNIIKIIDKIIIGQASNPYGTNYGINSYNQIEKVIDYVDRKNKLTNINLMTQKLIDSASSEEQELIDMRFSEKMTANEIAQYLKIDLRSVFRKIDKAISRLADIALLKGWTSCFVSSQLEDEAWVIERFDDFYNDYKNKVAKLQGNKQAD